VAGVASGGLPAGQVIFFNRKLKASSKIMSEENSLRLATKFFM
jgi:hypothetical protein